jgi:aspartate kinase
MNHPLDSSTDDSCQSMTVNTVEKIGGTSMSRFPELVPNLFMEAGSPVYGRIFVVSAYGGITDLLLEHKHSGEPGVFGLFSEGENDDEWSDRLTDVGRRMHAINAEFFESATSLAQADQFVDERITDARQCLTDLRRVCSFGPFALDAYIDKVRELLTSMGEAHSAHNAAMMLRERGINARFVDLTGWRDTRELSLDERLHDGLHRIDFETQLPITTGYAQCTEGLVRRFGRGYTEITTSRIAALTKPDEVIVHKEYHLSSADPKIVGVGNSMPIGRTNYDVADQLANLGMEAIHPSAATILRKSGIPLRVKHAFEPKHSGTLIDCDYRSDKPKVEIIAGRPGLMAIELFDQDMLSDQMGFETRFIDTLKRYKVRSIGKDLNANSITHYVACPLRTARRIVDRLDELFPQAVVESRKVAFVCAVGTDMDMPGILARCAGALGKAGVPILSVSQPLRGVDARFVVDEAHYFSAVQALHDAVIVHNSRVNAAA